MVSCFLYRPNSNLFYLPQKSGHSSRDSPNNRVNNAPVVNQNNVDPGTVNTIVLPSNPGQNTAHANKTTLHASETISTPSDRVDVAPTPMHMHLASHMVDHPSAVAPAGDPPVEGTHSKAYAEAIKEPLKPSHNAPEASSDDDEEFVDVAEFPMAVDPVLHKRDRSDRDSSDNSASHLDTRSKALIVGTETSGDGNLKDLFSPNLFSSLHDEAADLPLLVTDDGYRCCEHQFFSPTSEAPWWRSIHCPTGTFG
ncbi:Hypothetical predicted protein [Paramuricea clavata]|uniref:Uncharacterized protein n=1 Tax=Paramuricea clavata TaxID=317549 RepID=A0A7D9KZ07_PARCT|nr:Hypothetical predicted protein [Paramuricea clavata]